MNQFVDAIQFIFNEHESPAGGAQVGGLSNMWDLMSEHLQLSVVAMAIACALSIPLGLWLGHIGKGGFLAINVSNVGRAVPSLALIAFFVAYIGVGFTNLTLALVLLAIPPILTNTYTGVRQVDRDSVDSARGMGMTGAQIVRRVELPLALPLIFGGVRISAVEYLLMGAALVLFFVLLLAFAEVIGFTPAYVLASAAIAGLNTAYSAAVLGSWRRAAFIGGLLLGLYAVLYILLSLEAFSLLIGSLLLFAALAGVMYATRRIDWGGKRDPEEAAAPAA